MNKCIHSTAKIKSAMNEDIPDWDNDWGDGQTSDIEYKSDIEIDEMDMPAEIARPDDQYDLTTGIGAYGYICSRLNDSDQIPQMFHSKSTIASLDVHSHCFIFNSQYVCEIECKKPFVINNVDVPDHVTDDAEYVVIISVVYDLLGIHISRIVADYARESVARFSIGSHVQCSFRQWEVVKFPFSDFLKTPLPPGKYFIHIALFTGQIQTRSTFSVSEINTTFPMPEMLDFYIPAYDLQILSEPTSKYDWYTFSDYMRVELNIGAGSHYTIDFPSHIQLIELELVRRDKYVFIAYLYADSKLCEQMDVNQVKLGQFIGGEHRWPPGTWIDSVFKNSKPAAEFGRQLRAIVSASKTLHPQAE